MPPLPPIVWVLAAQVAVWLGKKVVERIEQRPDVKVKLTPETQAWIDHNRTPKEPT